MHFRSLLAALLVFSVCIASGVLECGGSQLTPVERRGAQAYARMCVVCHGATGQGYAADQAPALAHPNFLASVTDSALKSAIANGRSGSTMSAWSTTRGGPLSPGDVDALVAFLRTWHREPPVKLDERPLAGDATRGEAAFDRECARCHGAHGLSGPSVRIGNSELLATATHGFLRYAIRYGRPGTAMPAFGATLGAEGIDDVIAALRNWQTHAASAPQPPPAPRPPPMPLGPVPLHPKGPEPVGFRATPLLTPADVVKAQLERGARMGILDARAPSDYLNEHIAGAVSVPFYDPEPYLASLPRDAWLVCYCACPHAESGSLAGKLVQKGFTRVTVLDEGLPYWKNHKYPTRSGTEP